MVKRILPASQWPQGALERFAQDVLRSQTNAGIHKIPRHSKQFKAGLRPITKESFNGNA